MSDSANLPLKQTPLYEEHIKLGAKMIGFGGWNMPVFYSSILEEHQAVRQHVGIFDISHMGQIRVSGPSAEPWLNTLLTNNLKRLPMRDGQYTLLLNEQGGVIDDLIVYCRGTNDYFLVVNAAKIEEDYSWMQARLAGEVAVSDLSDHFAALAVQGPGSPPLLRQFGDLPARNQIQEFRIQGIPVLLARTGYTGEDGFELFYPAAAAAVVWNHLLDLGASLGVKPCGLGARDTFTDGGLLPVERRGPFADANTARSWSRFFRRPGKTGLCRTNSVACTKRSGLETAPRCAQVRWKISTAAGTL